MPDEPDQNPGQTPSARARLGSPGVRTDAPTMQPHAPGPAPRTGFLESFEGRTIGHYRIERLIGEGGMGAVYLARQENPDREVALKVIRPGYTSEATLRRFQFEAQVLGRLQHPGIAQIYEAGVYNTPERHAAGLTPIPYFAMEYVRGVDLADYARQRSLSVRQRLELHAKVCDAVEHAHTKGVVHRDLKPGNILVDESGQPKVLDFGTARAVDHEAGAVTLRTDVGQLVGTVPYMSPEQVSGDPFDIDTRTDVYALGVVLFEMLSGRLPHDLTGKMVHEAVAIIRDTEPTRLSTHDRTLRGDVETIVSAALEKDKGRRYASAGALAADIRRSLRDEPIVARPASTLYQLRKFVRRNQLLVASVAVVFLTLLGTVAVVSRSLVRAIEAEHQAALSLQQAVDARANEARLREKAEKERARAEDEAETSRQVAAFMDDMLASANPGAGNRLITVREVLDRSLKGVGTSLRQRPIVEAQARSTLAGSYLGLGEPAIALEQSRAALGLLEQHAGPDDPRTLEALSKVATAAMNLGDLDTAQKTFEEALTRHTRVSGENSRGALAQRNNLGQIAAMRGRVDEAEALFRRVVNEMDAQKLSDDPAAMDARANLAVVLQWQSEYAEAERLSLQILEGRTRVQGPEHPATLIAINNLASLRAEMGKPEEALTGYTESLDLSRKILGDDHPDTLTSLTNVAGGLTDLSRFAEGETAYREALALREKKLGPLHPDTIQNQVDLATNLDRQGRKDDALKELAVAVERGRASGEDRVETILAMFQQGRILHELGRYAEALPLLEEAERRQLAVAGRENWRLGMMRAVLGMCQIKLGRTETGEKTLLDGYELLRAQLGPGGAWTRRAAGALADLARDQNNPAREAQWREAAKGEAAKGEAAPG